MSKPEKQSLDKPARPDRASKKIRADGSLVESEVRNRYFDLTGNRRSGRYVNNCEFMLLVSRLLAAAKPGRDTQVDKAGVSWLVHSQGHYKKLSHLSRNQVERAISALKAEGLIETCRLQYGKYKQRRTGMRLTALGKALFDPKGSASPTLLSSPVPLSPKKMALEELNAINAEPIPSSPKVALKNQGKVNSGLAPLSPQIEGTPALKNEVTSVIKNLELAPPQRGSEEGFRSTQAHTDIQ